MTTRLIVPAYDDDTAMPVIARVSVAGDRITIGQACNPDFMWDGAEIGFTVANAEKVIDAIRAAVAASKTGAET